MSSKQPKSNYPRFIVDKPIGEDLFVGQSQNTLAENIIQFIKENDAGHKKVIGIEGEWGSGKSNVIEILKKKLSDAYYFFVFDAWGHQEDLTRRSILEGLLSKQLKDDVLKGEKKYWEDELKDLLAKKVEKKQKNIPQLSWAVILSILGILLTIITKSISENYLKTFTTKTSSPNFGEYLVSFLILLSAFLPLAVWIICSLIKSKGNWRTTLLELLYVYKGKEIENTTRETISEDEPTVAQFITFLRKLEKGSKKKLVIVFDNMDRLPGTKVKEIWSSIHTFFANDDNDLTTWAIVPFDNEHICNIFNDEDKNDKNPKAEIRADSYIHKTFSIVFHISPPILSDWKRFFQTKFMDAFGNTPPFREHIETIFEYHHLADPKIKPRDIIFFINDLVSLKKLRTDEIEFKYLALFALKRGHIMRDPFSEIVSKKYLGSLSSLFAYDENLDTSISALAFNVSEANADEVLLKRPIQSALQGQGDIRKLSKHQSFLTVFESVFYSSHIEFIAAMSCLENLPEEISDKPEMFNYWAKIVQELLQAGKFEVKYVDHIKILIQKLNSNQLRDKLVKFLFSNAIASEENKPKLFSGESYIKLIKEVEELLKVSSNKKNIEEYLSEDRTEATEYFEIIKYIPDDFKRYKIICEDKKVNDFLVTKLDADAIVPYFESVSFIKKTIDFSPVINHVNSILSTLTSTISGYQEKLANGFGIGKILAMENGKLPVIVEESKCHELIVADINGASIVDLLLCVVQFRLSTMSAIADQNCLAMLNTPTLNQRFLDSYTYFFNYQELINYDLQFPSVLMKSAIIELTTNDHPITILNIESIISKYVDIKSKIFDSKQEVCMKFLEKLNGFYNPELPISFVNEGNLSFIIPIISDNNSQTNNLELIDEIVKQSNYYLEHLPKEGWLASLKDSGSSPNINLFGLLLNTARYEEEKLPQQFEGPYGEIITAISKKEIPVPVNIELWSSMFERVPGNLTNTFKNVRDELLNHSKDLPTLNELLFFEKGLFAVGGLDEDQSTGDDVLRRILIPLISNDEKYIGLLKRNTTVVRNIIDKAKDSIINFQNELKAKCPDVFSNEELNPITNRLREKVDELTPKENNPDNS